MKSLRLHSTSDNPDRAAAARILALCKDKPIRVMGPADFSAGWVSQRGPLVKTPSGQDVARKARYALAKKCEAILKERGACTTVELAAATGQNIKAIGYACKEIDGIEVQDLTVKGSRSKLWMVPIKAATQPSLQRSYR